VTLLATSNLMFAQKGDGVKNKSEVIEVYNGKKIYYHTVLRKQTLYAIAKSYQVTVDTILAVNPDASKGIKTDQILKIPVMGEKQETVFYKVSAQETLFAISRQFNLDVSDLVKANPELSAGLKEGQIIIIPNKKTKNNIVDKNKVDVGPVKQNPCSPLKTNEAYNVALMIPLYLEDAYKISLGEVKVIEKFNKNKPFTFIPFYEGVLLALDSLQQTGMSVNLYVYDIEKDTNKVIALLEKPEIKTMDLIIGPFFNEPLKKVASFAKANNINVVSPLSFDNSVLQANPNVFQSMPSQHKQLESMANYILQNYPDREILIVHNGIEKDVNSTMAFKKIIDSLKPNVSENKIYKEIAYNKEGLAGIKKYLLEDKENIIVTFNTDEVFVMNYLRNLSGLSEKSKIILFGMPYWRTFENIEPQYPVKLNLHLTTSCFIDYESPDVINLVRKYREQYYSEPDKYVFQGFDEAFYFLSILRTYGKDFEQCIATDTIIKYSGLSTHLNFGKPGINGSENNFVTVYKYEDFKLVPLVSKE
jgi:LysM repeat protein/ABC-type branched-subunit amino acid transport system substrate-binding protein